MIQINSFEPGCFIRREEQNFSCPFERRLSNRKPVQIAVVRFDYLRPKGESP